MQRMVAAMANLKKVVSFIVSHPGKSSLLSLGKTSSLLEEGIGIYPMKTKLSRFYSTVSSNQKSLFNLRTITSENCDYEEEVFDINAFRYSLQVETYCDMGIVNSAIRLLEKMIRTGCKPNVFAYTVVIDSLLKMEGREDCALKLLRKMAFHQGIVPTASTYISLLHVIRILSHRDEYDISKFLKDMEDEGIDVGRRTFNIFVDAYCKEGRMEDAESLVKLMMQRSIDPNVVTYKRLIDGYCLHGNMSKSREVFDSMRCRGVVPDVFVYNTLLNGYCKDSKIQEAMHLFDEMMKSGVKPDECSLKIVLEGLCNNNKVEEAVSLFQSLGEKKLESNIGLYMGEKKLNSNIGLYNILIDGAIKSGKLDIAKTLYNDMSIKGLQPNDVTYAAMINNRFS